MSSLIVCILDFYLIENFNQIKFISLKRIGVIQQEV